MNLLTAGKSESIDVTTNTWTWANTGSRRPIGIYCNAESTIVGALVGDSDVSTWILPPGPSALAFKTITTASTTKNGYKILYSL